MGRGVAHADVKTARSVIRTRRGRTRRRTEPRGRASPGARFRRPRNGPSGRLQVTVRLPGTTPLSSRRRRSPGRRSRPRARACVSEGAAPGSAAGRPPGSPRAPEVDRRSEVNPARQGELLFVRHPGNAGGGGAAVGAKSRSSGRSAFPRPSRRAPQTPPHQQALARLEAAQVAGELRQEPLTAVVLHGKAEVGRRPGDAVALDAGGGRLSGSRRPGSSRHGRRRNGIRESLDVPGPLDLTWRTATVRRPGAPRRRGEERRRAGEVGDGIGGAVRGGSGEGRGSRLCAWQPPQS